MANGGHRVDIGGIAVSAQASLHALQELRGELLPQAESITQCFQASARVQQVLAQARRRAELQISQTVLEQSALSELHELYVAMM